MTILMIDDHKMVRENLSAFLEREIPNISILQAGSVGEAQLQIDTESVEALITDLSFPEGSGFELIRYVKSKYPNCSILVVTMHCDLDLFIGAFRAGANGYVTKESTSQVIKEALQEIIAGRPFIDKSLHSSIIDRLISGETNKPKEAIGYEKLTEREQTIFRLIVQNYKINHIANHLGISSKTVENHRATLYNKLGVTDRLEAFRLAQKLGIVV